MFHLDLFVQVHFSFYVVINLNTDTLCMLPLSKCNVLVFKKKNVLIKCELKL